MENGIMANGDKELFEEIKTSYDDIGKLLEIQEPNMREVLKKFLATNRLIMAFFIGTFLEDHKKVETMWAAHKIITFVSTGFGVSLIALMWALITGRAEIVVGK